MSFSNPRQTPPNPADSKPTLRDGAVGLMTQQFRETIEALHVDMFKTCLTCVNFQEHAKGNLTPAQWCSRFSPQVGPVPARIVAYGCSEYYHDDEIPF